MANPTRPKDAASLVIVRKRASGFEVLMGRRPPRDRFVPDVWVFPGGAVDASDRTTPILEPLAAAQAQRVDRAEARGHAHAIAVAAVRETFEETGLRFGERRGGELVPDLRGLEYIGRAITPVQSPTRYHARFFLVRGEHARGRLRGNGELLDLRWLHLREATALPLMDVTQVMLDQAARRLRGMASEGTAFVYYRQGVPQCRYE